MRKTALLLIAFILCFSLFGCVQAPQMDKPVTFYYRVAQLSYETDDTVIASEVREAAQMGSLSAIVQVYLAGPQTDTLANPFPAGLILKNLSCDDSTVYITVSSELADLTGLSLTIACGCMTMTLLELTGMETVCITAEDALLDGAKSITMDKNSLLLFDNSGEKE